MKKHVILFFSLCLFIAAHAEESYYVYGNVKDKITQQLLAGVKVSVFKGAELLGYDGTSAGCHMSGDDEGYYYCLEVGKDSATYTFRYEKEGYETVEKTIFVKRFKKIEHCCPLKIAKRSLK